MFRKEIYNEIIITGINYSVTIKSNNPDYDPDILSDLSLSLISLFRDLELDKLHLKDK